MGKSSVPFLGETSAFGEAFPEIESICIEYVETGEMPANTGERKGRITEKSRVPSRLPCSNKNCKDGGFNIEHELRMMVLQKLETSEGSLSCLGHEKGRNNAALCSNFLKFKITARYKP